MQEIAEDAVPMSPRKLPKPAPPGWTRDIVAVVASRQRVAVATGFESIL